jgi:hypothetical protein
MEKEHTDLQARMRTGESPARPTGSGLATIVSQEKLADVPGKTLTVQVVDVPPGGRVPEHHPSPAFGPHSFKRISRLLLGTRVGRDPHFAINSQKQNIARYVVSEF